MCGCESFFVSPAELFSTPTPTSTQAIDPNVTVVPEITNDPVVPTVPVSDTPALQPSATSTEAPTATPSLEPTPSPTATPSPIPTVPPAPATLNSDPATIDYVVNRACLLPDNYEPADLVKLTDIGIEKKNVASTSAKLRKVAAEALKELLLASNAEGLHLVAVSGYRSFDYQYQIYGNYLFTYGIEHTNRYSAVPGSSEHQTGLAMDVSCAAVGNDLITEFVNTPEGKWLYEHCWEYGFIIRYQKGKVKITGYEYEPWHIRYVGIPLAYYLTTTGITLDEYYGVCDPYDDDYLKTHPLIDTSTPRYHKLYADAKCGQLIPTADGTAWVNPATGYPYLIPALRDSKKNLLRNINNELIYNQPLTNCFGEYYFDENGNLMTKPVYSDAEGNPILNINGEAFFLEPLVDGDGSFIRDENGNIMYRELLTDSLGQVWTDAEGNPFQLLPLRDDNTFLVFSDLGEVIYYTPFTDAAHLGEGGTAEFLIDANGNLRFSAWYYIASEQELTIAVTESGLMPSNE